MKKRWYSKRPATSKDEKNVNEADGADARNNTHWSSLLRFVDRMLQPGAPWCSPLKSEFHSVRGLRVRSNPKSSTVCSMFTHTLVNTNSLDSFSRSSSSKFFQKLSGWISAQQRAAAKSKYSEARVIFYFLFHVGKVTSPDWKNITQKRQEQHCYSAPPPLMICERQSFKRSDRYIRAFSKAAWQKKKKNLSAAKKETFCLKRESQGTFLNFVTFFFFFSWHHYMDSELGQLSYRYSEVERKPFVIVLKPYHLPEGWRNKTNI